MRQRSTKRDLPKGIYDHAKKRGYTAAFWNEGGKMNHVGQYPTVDEAEYARNVAMNGTHWVGIEEGPFFGFTYCITHKPTGKMYIGKKQFYLWTGPAGGFKQCDPAHPEFDRDAWKPNTWEFYTGSQLKLNKFIADGEPLWNFKWEVLDMGRDKLDMHLSEVGHHISNDVLEAVDENGEYLYWNENIAGLDYRAPFKKADVAKKAQESMDAVRHYYLKPVICTECNEAIPYGDIKCKCVASKPRKGQQRKDNSKANYSFYSDSNTGFEDLS